MSRVINWSIKFEPAGDLYAGRCVLDCDHFGKDVAQSLASFHFSKFDSLEKESMNQCFENWIKARMTAGGVANNSVFLFFKAYLASFVFHRAWLDSTFHMENGIRCSPLWSEAILFSDHVTNCYQWNRIDTPEKIGLLVDVVCMKNFKAL